LGLEPQPRIEAVGGTVTDQAYERLGKRDRLVQFGGMPAQLGQHLLVVRVEREVQEAEKWQARQRERQERGLPPEPERDHERQRQGRGLGLGR